LGYQRLVTELSILLILFGIACFIFVIRAWLASVPTERSERTRRLETPVASPTPSVSSKPPLPESPPILDKTKPLKLDPREIEGEIYLDIETLRLSTEVPDGWSSIDQFGVAVAVTWDLHGQFRSWFEQDVNDLVNELKKFERIVTYNGERFDFKVLSGYTSTRGLSARSFDVLVELTHTLGHRVKLDDVARHTLGVGKSGDGVDAVRWWREGKREQVTEYCRDDVELLVRIVAHAREHGYVRLDGRRIPVNWSPLSRPLTRRSSKSIAQGVGSSS
jgi:hypothetical protein